MNAPLDPLIEGYLSYLDKIGCKTPRTIVDVRCTLRRAIAGLDRVRPGVDLWRLGLEDFLHWMEEERQLKRTNASLAKYLSHVRGFLEYAWRSGRTERNVLDGFSLQHTIRRTVPNFLNLEEAQRLVHATEHPGPTARRDRPVILLLYGCGLRTNELCSLNVADVNCERHELVVVKGRAIGLARSRSPRHSTRRSWPTSWSMASAAPCSERACAAGASPPTMSAIRCRLHREQWIERRLPIGLINVMWMAIGLYGVYRGARAHPRAAA